MFLFSIVFCSHFSGDLSLTVLIKFVLNDNNSNNNNNNNNNDNNNNNNNNDHDDDDDNDNDKIMIMIMIMIMMIIIIIIVIMILKQEPITRSEHLPYLLLELSFLQTELFLERLSRQANNAFVY